VPNMTPGLMRLLKAGLFLSAFGWGLSFVFTIEPWNRAVLRLYQMGAEQIPYQPLLAYWLKMASAVFGCLGVASAICFMRTERMIEVIRLLVPLHLVVGITLVCSAASNKLDPAIHKSFVADIAFCFVVAGLIGVPLAIQARRRRASL
jgi:hypothetical protein